MNVWIDINNDTRIFLRGVIQWSRSRPIDKDWTVSDLNFKILH